jgi:iron complex outermembrane receptor protein
LASSALLIAAALGSSAHAQSKSATTAAASNTIEELVVTAEKRSQNLQDVPVAITAFTSANRDLVGISTIQDMTNFTPGLAYSSSTDRTTLRGIGRLSNQQSLSTAVAVYDDGIFTKSTVTAGKTPIFTDRVEVLSGPQGTLYGRNSIGGAINVISKHPTEDPYAEVRARFENYDHFLVEGAVSGPLAPDLQYRLAANWEKQSQGYFTNIVPNMPSEGNVIDQYYVEGQLQAKFGEHADGWVKVAIAGWNNGGGGPGARAGYGPGPFNFGEFGSQNVAAGFACSPGGVVTQVVNNSPLGCINPASKDPRKFADNIAQSVSLDDTYIISGNLTWHFDGADLKYIVGGNNYHYTLFQDNGTGSISSFVIPIAAFNPALAVTSQPCAATNLAAPGACAPLKIFPNQTSTYQEDFHNISHEFDLTSTGNGPLQWLGGLYYYKEGIKQPVFTTLAQQPQLSNGSAVVAAVPTVTGASVGLPFQSRLFDDRPQFHNESYAVFGQLDWKFTDTWKATLGLRYTHDHLTGVEAQRVLCFAVTACGTTPEALGTTFTPIVDVTAAVTNLASLPRGVVAGGINNSGVTFTPDGFAHRAYDASWEATTGTAGVQWEPTKDTMIYARYNRGYNEGGFAVGVASTMGSNPFTDAEHVNDYEVGFKTQIGHDLQVDVAAFYYDFLNYQAPLTVVNNSGGLAVSQSGYINIPKAVSEGIELETTWTPIDNLRILFTYGFNPTKVVGLTNVVDPADPLALQPGAKPVSGAGALTACTGTGTTVTATNPKPNPLCDAGTGFVQRPQNLDGNALPQASRNKVAVNVLYTWNFEKGSLTPSASYVWRDQQYSSFFQRTYDASPSWDQVDARVTWKDKDNRYTIIAYVKNAFDRLGYDGGAGGGRNGGVYNNNVIAASTDPKIIAGLPSTATFTNGLLTGTGIGPGSITQSYALTPPRTYGIELQYRF